MAIALTVTQILAEVLGVDQSSGQQGSVALHPEKVSCEALRVNRTWHGNTDLV